MFSITYKSHGFLDFIVFYSRSHQLGVCERALRFVLTGIWRKLRLLWPWKLRTTHKNVSNQMLLVYDFLRRKEVFLFSSGDSLLPYDKTGIVRLQMQQQNYWSPERWANGIFFIYLYLVASAHTVTAAKTQARKYLYFSDLENLSGKGNKGGS